MAGFQTASLMVSDHPVLYGTTLAISLVGSVAALSPSVVSVPVARVEYTLSLAETALAAATNFPVMNAAKPAAGNASVVTDQGELPVGKTPESKSSSPAERHFSAMQIGLEATPPSAVPTLSMTDFATKPQQAPKGAPPSISAPATAAMQVPRREPLVAAPASGDVTAQPSQSFAGAFEAIPTPSLAVAAERSDEVRTEGLADPDAAALVKTAPKPDQSSAAFAPVPIASQTKPIDLPAGPSAVVQTLARAPEPAVAPDPVVSKLSVTSAALPVETAFHKADAKPAPAPQPLRLINSPQLRKFDLARIHSPARTPTAALAPAPAKPSQAGTVRIAPVKDRLVGGIVYHQVAVTVAGSSAKALDVRIGADMIPAIKVGDLLGLVSDRMDPASAARFAAAASASEYVSLASLRASGFTVSYNAGTDSISIAAAD